MGGILSLRPPLPPSFNVVVHITINFTHSGAFLLISIVLFDNRQLNFVFLCYHVLNRTYLICIMKGGCEDCIIQCSGGSRISRRGGVDLRRGHFSVKMYVKMKELGPIGGACAGHAPPQIRQCSVFCLI